MAAETPQVSHSNTLLESKTLPIFLRTLELQDAPAFARLLSDPRNASDPSVKPMELSIAQTVIARMRESAAQPTVYSPDGQVISGPGRVNLAVVLRAEDARPGDGEKVIGLGGYGGINELERDGKKIRAGDAGVLIDADYRGKGYATEAMRLAMDWGFSSVGEGGPQFDRITITTLSDNEAMVKLVNDKLGLKGKSSEGPAEFDEKKTQLSWELKPEDWRKN